jgi:DNA-binding Lrp family transcriptional regulator
MRVSPIADKLDDIDKAILNRIQSDFPIDRRPYDVIARQLGLEEAQVLERVKALKTDGVIRRIGGNLVPRKIGFVSTLCAARVPIEKIEAFAAVVNGYPGVTHNYQRDHLFNVWFTFIAPSSEVIRRNLSRIEETTGVGPILNLPATHVFKIRAEFDV